MLRLHTLKADGAEDHYGLEEKEQAHGLVHQYGWAREALEIFICDLSVAAHVRSGSIGATMWDDLLKAA